MGNECSTDKGQEQCSPGQGGVQQKNDSDCCDIPAKLLCIADEAWHEVLKEKLKKQIEAHAGEKLDKLAQVVAEANHQRWSHKISEKKHCHSYQDKVKEIMLSMTE